VGAYEMAAAPPGTLTPRERQVAALVASGRSNKAIADELVISPATAARHVANILAKLGFSSRAQIAAWATDRQLGLSGPSAANGPAQRAVRRAGQQRFDERRGLPDTGGKTMTARAGAATTRHE
ncbi:MAG TPA: helix-turn-helix transcriptional regulator, partial [Candidatus Eisenbacteria bacterium]|nr:helix-turn-helix transcriptional regulator [Candidatus Eisenbacteria bacterium]